MAYGKMTLREAAKRLSEIVERNDKTGLSEWNDRPLLIEVKRKGQRRVRDWYYTAVRYISDSTMALTTKEGYEKFGGSITVQAEDLLKK
jgi:hypothetical protein